MPDHLQTSSYSKPRVPTVSWPLVTRHLHLMSVPKAFDHSLLHWPINSGGRPFGSRCLALTREKYDVKVLILPLVEFATKL